MAVLLGTAAVATALWLPVGGAAPAQLVQADREAWLGARAREADTALGRLQADLELAIASGRRGTALVVDGNEDPAPDLRAAAEQLDRAASIADEARRALASARGVARSVAPGLSLGGVVGSTDLGGIASQLRAAAEAAGPFVAQRHAAATTVERLGDALAALDRDDPEQALTEVAAAEEALGVVAAWEKPPPTLPVWLDTTRALLAATRDLAAAVIAGDEVAANAASEAYRTATDAARRADAALAIAISEAGSSLAAVPLQRLAEAMADIDQVRAGLTSMMRAQD